MKFLIVLLFVLIQTISPQEQIINVTNRTTFSLNGDWSIIIDPYENGYYNYRYEVNPNGYFKNAKPKSKSDLVEYDFDTSDKLKVPADWNTQRKDLFFYEGTVWYKRSFNYYPKIGRRFFLYFGAINYNAKVYFNGEKVGEHIGGFTPFNFEVTSLMKNGENYVVVKVDNKRTREGVPTLNTDWWNYGGITRDVVLIELPDTFIEDYFIQLDKNNSDKVTGWIKLNGSQNNKVVKLKIKESNIDKVFNADENSKCTFTFEADLIKWTPESPKLYDVIITTNNDSIVDQIGFRTIEVRNNEILLNGKSVFLRGISIHEESPMTGGRATSENDAEKLLGYAKELSCNFVRLAHYPHNEYMVKEADKLGLLVWSEIPVYWTILWEKIETFNLALQQLSEMINRDKNRASVIIWSVANETPRSENRMRFLTNLIKQARLLDPTRLISAATELTYNQKTITVDDPLSENLDVIGANEYLGWYSYSIDEIKDFIWKTNFNKPLIISEFGGGALYGLHGDEQTRWTEEYQAAIYREQLKMLSKISFVKGMSPWILVDFRSPRRPLPEIQDFYNRKGIISNDGNKKQAYYILQDFYDEISNK